MTVRRLESILRIFYTTRCAINSRQADHFMKIVQVLNGKFCKEFTKIEADLEKEGAANPLNELYRRSEESELGQAEKRVRARLAGLIV